MNYEQAQTILDDYRELEKFVLARVPLEVRRHYDAETYKLDSIDLENLTAKYIDTIIIDIDLKTLFQDLETEEEA